MPTPHFSARAFALTAVIALLIVGGVILIAKPGSPLSQPTNTNVATNTGTTTNQTTPTAPTMPKSTHTGPTPLYFTTMTHMEGDFTDDKDQNLFNRHVKDMRWAMDLFDEYGVKLTFESEQSFAKANTIWGVNIMKEAVDRGFGVGTHADFGAGSGKELTLEQLTQDFKRNKALVDGLVGAANNHGVSGGTGPTDWVLAASAAEFDYIDAVTAFGYLSMPLSVRPSGWTDAAIRSTYYHDSIPTDLGSRLYPLALKDATDLVPDANPAIVLMNGDIGELASVAEGRKSCSPNCILDSADVDTVESDIKQADSLRDHSQFARLNVHIPMNLLNIKNETTLRELLTMLKSYADKGTIKFATQYGSYQAYKAWNK